LDFYRAFGWLDLIGLNLPEKCAFRYIPKTPLTRHYPIGLLKKFMNQVKVAVL
jgi:hypothetical protein